MNKSQSSIRDAKFESELSFAPRVRAIEIEVPPPHANAASGDQERFFGSLREASGISEFEQLKLTQLRSLQKILRTNEWVVRVAFALNESGVSARVIDVFSPSERRGLLGLVVDVGSTTIVGHLCDLGSGAIMASHSMINPQVPYGADVMSRVSYVMMNEGGTEELSKLAQKALLCLVDELVSSADTHPNQIIDAVIVCNPIMQHLMVGIDPTELGSAPFAISTSSSIEIGSTDLGLPIHPAAHVYFPDAVGGQIGADATSALLAANSKKAAGVTLLVDIGTNAEIFLISSDGILATSSPTGPALEGASISCGQRAGPGVIERVRIDPRTKELRFKVIGSERWSNEPAFVDSLPAAGVTGICGSGIVEAVAELRLAGIIDQTGRIGSAEQTGTSRCIRDGRTSSYLVWEDPSPIVLSSTDIRQVQMAKAALYASIRLLMLQMGTNKIDRVELTGTFGSHLSAHHALLLGLIPSCDPSQIASHESLAGLGAKRLLLEQPSRKLAKEMAASVKRIETAIHPDFQREFLEASRIPPPDFRCNLLDQDFKLPEPNFNTRRRNRQA